MEDPRIFARVAARRSEPRRERRSPRSPGERHENFIATRWPSLRRIDEVPIGTRCEVGDSNGAQFKKRGRSIAVAQPLKCINAL